MDNSILKKINNETKIIGIVKIIIFAVVSIIFTIMIINSINHLSYKEVDAILMSYDKLTRNNDGSGSCIGTYEYYVNDVKYEASIYTEYDKCQVGYIRKVYYDSNNPKMYSDNKSIFMLCFFLAIDAVVILSLNMSIKEFIENLKYMKKSNSNQHKNSEDIKSIELDSDIYGKYMLEYDPNDTENKYNNDEKTLSFTVIKSVSEAKPGIFEIILPSDILNTIFETNKMNNILESYYKIELNDYKKIIEKLINQEIETLSNWCDVPVSDNGKKMLLDNGSMMSTKIEIDNSFSIKTIHWSYSYDSATPVSVEFTYDIKTGKIEITDVWCS